MKWLRRLALVSGILLTMVLLLAGHYYYKGFFRARIRGHATGAGFAPDETERRRVMEKASEQKTFLSGHGLNNGVCFLVDMRMPSGKNRFFVYDMEHDTILMAGLVAHGCGAARFSMTPVFSNRNGSGCTSLGRYRIGYRYKGQFGPSYKLYGLDTSNDQAFARNVVLHSFNMVPDGETYPYPICNSRGCPMVAPGFFKNLQNYIDTSKKSICLWIFD